MTAEGTVGEVQERIGQATSTSREEAANVSGTVQAEAKDVAQTAKTQAESAMHQMIDDLRSHAEDQASKLAETMHSASGQLRSMAEAGEQQSVATTLVREGANAAERLAGKLDDGGIDGALAEVRTMARRSPGAFLLGAATAGLVTGRLMRNFSAQSSSAMPEGAESGFPPAFDLGAAESVDRTWANGRER